MSIFEMHESIIDAYRKYVQSFLSIADKDLREFVEHELFERNILWPHALLQLNPAFEMAATVEDLVSEGKLDPVCAQIFRNNGRSIHLYRHQQEAILNALAGEHSAVTSGTGSGKSLTYLIPIFDHIVKRNPDRRSVRAIIVYPMNALVNSQHEAIDKLLGNLGKSSDRLRVERYTGQEDNATKLRLQQHPPHVLLTNYVMLELMLTRPQEKVFVDKSWSALTFLVLDELHTYRGRQGADVAVLVRRLRERCGNPKLVCIGTSATMATGGSPIERREGVAGFASKLFGVNVKPENVVEETLRRVIPRSSPPTAEDLRRALREPLVRAQWEDFAQNALSAWIEETFGVEEEADGHLRRRIPITLRAGAGKLSKLTGVEEAICEERLRDMLLLGSGIKTPDGDTAFAFKLHQFISQGGSVYATVEPPEERYVALGGQYYAPGERERLLYPLVFCRVCGQEYYVVEWNREKNRLFPSLGRLSFVPDEVMEDEKVESGYVMLDPDERWQNESSALPDHWFERTGRIKTTYRPFHPRLLRLNASGEVVEGGEAGVTSGWFLKSPFMLCLRCGEAYTLRDKVDFRKLSRLSSEGRSTATTVLALSTIGTMRRMKVEPSAQKVLSFMDNRQDASLQAGHFNDFVQVALLRSGLYQALRVNQELQFDRIAPCVMKALDLPFSEYAQAANLDPGSPRARRTRATFGDVLEYRLYEDLRRGWRVIQPNLEQCGLLKIDYEGLEALPTREELWTGVLLMEALAVEERAEVLRTLLDEMRRQLSIDVECLRRERREELRRRTREYLNERWAFDENERLRHAPLFVLPGSEVGEGDLSLSRLGLIGRWLRQRAQNALGREINESEYNQLIEGLMQAACGFGLVIEKQEKRRHGVVRGVRLRPSALIWRLGDGRPVIDPLRRHQATGEAFIEIERRANEYFSELYQKPLTALKGMDGAEHTAQIRYERRIDREQRFRDGRISTLFCSPTMELGIDIADLNAVHMRNVPPTPANYAQRSGRAGRAGQPAIVVAYCAYGSGHDQYFFRHREQMVAGVVVPPQLDLSNEDLLRAHVHAIWLTRTRISLGRSMRGILDMEKNGYPLHKEIDEQINLSEEKFEACLGECQRVLTGCGADLEMAEWFSDGWVEETLRSAPQRFDRAFDRWRELFRAAWNQLLEAQQMRQRIYLGRGAASRDDGSRAAIIEREALRQLDLLCCQNTKYDESDFYPYRYLASEGFLPGYNFPALPVRAYIPRGSEGEFIARPRFLALTEFGPHNVIYHDGAKYQVRRAILPVQEPERQFVRAKLCQMCGTIHEGEARKVDTCEHCGVRLGGENSLYLTRLLEMPTAGTRPRERITCDEEERRRWGYQVTTHFRFARAAAGRVQRRPADVLTESGKPILEMSYAPAANLWRINHQWRRSKEPGFRLDMSRGTWLGQGQNGGQAGAEQRDVRSNVRVFVRATANALLVHADAGNVSERESFLANLQYALTRGIQAMFQVEASELASERIGQGEKQGILLWEAAEGGLGVLRRLVEEPDALSGVARAALEILHFDAQTGKDQRPVGDPHECARACYDCLLSYYNQRDHHLLNRHGIRDFLRQLAGSVTRAGGPQRSYEEHYRWLRTLTDIRSELERTLLDRLYATKRRLPEAAQRRLRDIEVTPDFFYEPNVCVFCDGRVHDEPQQQARDEQIRRELKDHGYRVIVIRYDDDLEQRVGEHSDVFGTRS